MKALTLEDNFGISFILPEVKSKDIIKPISIGRGSANDINVPDMFVSRKHCALIGMPVVDKDENVVGTEYHVFDRGSTNGTYLDGDKLGYKQRILTEGAKMELGGSYSLHYTQKDIEEIIPSKRRFLT